MHAAADAVRHQLKLKVLAWQEQRFQQETAAAALAASAAQRGTVDSPAPPQQRRAAAQVAIPTAAADATGDRRQPTASPTLRPERWWVPELISPGGPQDWVSIDAGPVVVHVLTAAARKFYELDDLWVTDVDRSRVERFEAGAAGPSSAGGGGASAAAGSTAASGGTVYTLDTMRVEDEEPVAHGAGSSRQD